jgi:hypothetical protein
LKKYDNDVSKITVDDCNILIGKFMAKKQQGGSSSGSSGGTDLTAKFKAGSGAKSAGASSKTAEKPKRKVAVRKETVKKEDTDGVKPKKVVVRKKKE